MSYMCTLTHKVHCNGFVYTPCSAPSSGRTVELQYSVVEIFKAVSLCQFIFSSLAIYFSIFVFPHFFMLFTHTQTWKRDVDELLPPRTVTSACCWSAFPVWFTSLLWPRVFWDPATAAGLWDSWAACEPVLERSLKGVFFSVLVFSLVVLF